MPKIIQNYTLHEQIGEGQYGKVYKGVDSRKNNSSVAVKVINVKKFKDYPKLQQCTLNQIQVLSKIDSPHIVRFIQILKTANNFYFFYEYCNEGTLEEAIKLKGSLSENIVFEYLTQILQGFRVLVSRNIMHRDLKPSNILLKDGKIKLADFGFCKSLQSHRDLAQTMLGSPIYMAPEVLKGEIYTIKADIWSLGVVIYEMLYGFCPFQERSIARLINLLDEQEVVFNSQINNISPDLQKLVERMLVKDHFKRISWDEIFNYKINGRGLTVSEKTSPRQMRNLNNYSSNRNTSEKKPFRPSIEFKNDQSQQNKPKQVVWGQQSPTSPKALFKKKTKQNKQNNETLPIKQAIVKESSHSLHLKIKHFTKLTAKLIDLNYCPDLTIQLCLKMYNILLKEHARLPLTEEIKVERQTMMDVIRIFQEQSLKTDQKEKIGNGPILTSYIKRLQGAYKDSFNATVQSKELVLHCLELLELNEMGCEDGVKDYSIYNKEKLLSELYYKVIRNVI